MFETTSGKLTNSSATDVYGATGASGAIAYTSNGCTVSGLDISYVSSSGGVTGIGLATTSSGIISDCDAHSLTSIGSTAYGISFSSSSGELTNSVASDVYGATGATGVAVDSSTGFTISSVDVSDISSPGQVSGISVATTSAGTVSDSEAYSLTSSSGNTYGISLYTSPGISISGSSAYSLTAAGTIEALQIYSSDNVSVDGFTAHSASGLSEYGIRSLSSTGGVFKNFLCYDFSVPDFPSHMGCGYLAGSAGNTLYHGTIVDCDAGYAVFGVTATATNCIAENNTYNWVDSMTGGTWNKTSCTDDGGVLFADYSGDDFHLAETDSVAKDRGSPLSGVADTDIDGHPRPFGTARDIGADEYFLAPDGWPCFQRAIVMW